MQDKDKEKELDELFWKERKVETMVYAIERVMQQEKLDSFAEGEAKGKAEIAKEMLKMGLSEQQIQQATKLPLSTIQELAKELDL